MPELPEVETVRRTVVPLIQGATITGLVVHDPRLRVLVDHQALQRYCVGRRVTSVRRRAKYLLFDLADPTAPHTPTHVMMVHLGMTGTLGVLPSTAPQRKHDHVVWSFEGSSQTETHAAKQPARQALPTHLRFNDPRRFGLVELFAAEDENTHPRLAALGPEPLGQVFTAEHMRAAAQSVTKQPIKSFLMDNHRVVGVGNIYASEALHRAGIHPQAPAKRLSLARWQRLVIAVQKTLRAAIEQGGTTLRDFANVRGEAGYFTVALKVYDQAGKPCQQPSCAGIIRKTTMGGRATYYCPRCQCC